MAQQQNTSIFSAGLVGPAMGESFVKLDPRQLVRNPVIFIKATVAVLATVLLIRMLASGGQVAFEAQIVFWLWPTVLFGNFAEALVEGRGRAQAASLRSTKTSGPDVEKEPNPQKHSPQTSLLHGGQLVCRLCHLRGGPFQMITPGHS